MLKLLDIFGYTVFELTHTLENGRIVLGCDTVKFDGDGKIIKKTQSSTLSLGFSDRALTSREYSEITER